MPINFRCIKGCGGVSLTQDNKVLGIVGSELSALKGYTEAIAGEHFQNNGKVIYFGDNKAYSTVSNEYIILNDKYVDFNYLTRIFMRDYKGEVLVVINDINRIGNASEVAKFLQDNSDKYIVFSCISEDEEFVKYLPVGIDYIICKSSRRTSQSFFSDTRSSTISSDDIAYYKSKTCKACILPHNSKYTEGVRTFINDINRGDNCDR